MLTLLVIVLQGWYRRHFDVRKRAYELYKLEHRIYLNTCFL